MRIRLEEVSTLQGTAVLHNAFLVYQRKGFHWMPTRSFLAQNAFHLFVLAELAIESRAFHVLGKCSGKELYPLPIFFWFANILTAWAPR